jgi:hypothetical protein
MSIGALNDPNPTIHLALKGKTHAIDGRTGIRHSHTGYR